MTEHPVFYDPRGRRGRLASVLAGLVAFAVAAVTILVVIVSVFLSPRMASFGVTHHQTTYQDTLKIDRRGTTVLAPALRQLIATDVHNRTGMAGKKGQDRIVLGYYSNDYSAGLQSLKDHATSLTHIAPQWLYLTPRGDGIDYERAYDPAQNPRTAEVDAITRRNGIRVLPILSNAGVTDFDRTRSARLLRDPALQQRIAQEILGFLLKHNYDGLHLDLENLNADDDKGLLAFAKTLQAAFAPHHLSVSAAVEVDNDELDLVALAQSCDFLVPMLYDQHDETGTEGAIASLDWSDTSLEKVLKRVPESKVVMAVGNFAYDWSQGKAGAQSMSFQEALEEAKGYRSEPPSQVLRFDEDSSNTTFAYRDDDDKPHRVWLLDAVSAYNQCRSASDLGLRGAALWSLGEEDPAIWSFFSPKRLFGRVDPAALGRISFASDVDFVGRGEILNVQSQASDGARRVTLDPDGLVEACQTLRYASAYVIRKSGYVPKKLALTFDDGPDPQWTPEILDVLKRFHTPATFFDIGANVEEMPKLAAREYDEGHEVGNHSFTHPDLGSVADFRARAEITLTQMAIEGATGHSSVLFRPPYNADSEPETPDQLKPVQIADALGYVTVGENVDPTDWDPTVVLPNGESRPRTAKDIADFVVNDLKRREGTDDEGNIILLHDAGGPRGETVKALAALIPRLRAEGYEFVKVSRLMGKTRDAVMAPISAKTRLSYTLGRWALGTAFAVLGALAVAFQVAVFLGVARMGLVVPLSLVQRRRETGPRAATGEPISVVIAAYNEAAVIARTVESVLASDVELLEVIVVDDGSTDGTADVVRVDFRNDPRVQVIAKPNGGKASALNLGIASARGDLLFHVDADTLLEPSAIGRLAGHFADPTVAAVAGNVQVGNRINLLTKWQDLEYVTSQNLDRRAYDRLNCITVVPGAIGMWRRAAVLEVGGYQTDTLAEDMDLTWRLRQHGYRLANEPGAYAYTEAPERFGPFLRQRFRWSYGTLQCLCKHWRALGRYGWFGRVALPTQWLFGVVFQALAPLVDLQALLAILLAVGALIAPYSENAAEQQAHAFADLGRFGLLYALFLVVESLGAMVALRQERRPLWSVLPLILQRFVYRQMMYLVMYQSLVRAISGGAAGWGKLKRTGSVRVPTAR